MTHFLPPVFIAAITTAAASVGELGPETHVSLQSSLAVGAVVLTGAWWIGRYMQKIDDRMDALEKAVGDQKAKCKGLCARYEEE